MNTRASGRWISAPMPWDRAAGRKPITATIADTTIERNRISQPALDRVAPRVAFAPALGEAVGAADLGGLGERTGLPAGRAVGRRAQGGDRIAGGGEPYRDAEAALPLEVLGDHPALGGGLD